MDNNKDRLKDFFRGKLKDYECPVRRDLWISLENYVPVQKSLWRKIYPLVASVASVMIAGILFYAYFIKVSSDSAETVVSVTERPVWHDPVGTDHENTNEAIEVTGVAEDTYKPIKSAFKGQRDDGKQDKDSLLQNDLLAETVPVLQDQDEFSGELTTLESDSIEQEPSVAEKPVEREESQKNIFPERAPDYNRSYYTQVRSKTRLSSGLQLSVSGNGFLAMDNELDILKIYHSDYLSAYENQFQMNELFPGGDGTGSGGTEGGEWIPPDYTLVNIKYHTPVTLGLYVSKNFSSRWAIETGVNYTKLTSREIWEGENHYDHSTNLLTSEIKLHYIGIPLKASYYIIKKAHFSVYVTGGGLIEKCVSGKAVTTSENEGKIKNTKLDIPELQFSIAGGAGVEYRLFRPVSLFVEPGVIYYFDDGSDIMTIRKDKPFNFNIQGGLRFSF